jgi:hypothetical protein
VASGYEWSPPARRWRNRSNGRFVAERTLTSWRNQARAALEDEATRLMDRLADGDITIQFWETEMRDLLRKAHISEYLLARGGTNALTAADRARIGAELDRQFAHLRNFTRQLMDGTLSQEAAAARARMYPRSGNTLFNMGRENAWNIRLPGHPGEGVQCLSNCRCSWQISTRGKLTIASWKVSPGDSCDDCVDRGRRWAHLEFDQA